MVVTLPPWAGCQDRYTNGEPIIPITTWKNNQCLVPPQQRAAQADSQCMDALQQELWIQRVIREHEALVLEKALGLRQLRELDGSVWLWCIILFHLAYFERC